MKSYISLETLRHIDKKLTIDQREATSFLLLDGHGSRFQLPFLQNRAFKQALTVSKQELLKEKETDMWLGSVNIEQHDKVGLVHYSWYKSFACEEASRKATAA